MNTSNESSSFHGLADKDDIQLEFVEREQRSVQTHVDTQTQKRCTCPPGIFQALREHLSPVLF